MKREEKVAKVFLKAFFGTEPIYEPLGKGTAPDFSIGTTAFEVRRLNQQHVSENGTTEGLEQVEHPLSEAVSGELNKVSFSQQRGTFYWGLGYKRPLQAKPGQIARALAQQAASHYASGSRAEQTIEAYGVTIRLVPARTPRGKAFHMGYISDDDSGGFIGGIYLEAMRFALKEKIAKTRNIAHFFNRWVLVLVDAIMPEISWVDEVVSMTWDLGHFNSVAVIDVTNGSLEFEWPRNSLGGAVLRNPRSLNLPKRHQ
ncbi:MAG TPA: hypothetical protein VGW33_08975 [Terriglobia bacterium]|nr:hypothetical protein [Terriglobia bacterium]